MSPGQVTSTSWSSHGFGLALESAFPLAGCEAGRRPVDRPRVRLELADRADLTAALGPDLTAVMAWRSSRAGRRMPRLTAHPSDGYLISAPRGGLFHVSGGGDLVRCAPVAVAPWLWQRSLLGEVLPFVSALRGLEALHASAVVPSRGSPAIAVAAAPGRGKSSVAVELLLAGGLLLADDVTAVEARDGTALAHPAMGLLSLGGRAARRAEDLRRAGIGFPVGTSRGSMRVSVHRHEDPAPLGAIYFLEPAGDSPAVRLVAVRPPDPRILLGSTFNVALRTRERLVAQLDACGAIAGSVRMVRVAVPAGVDFAALAKRILADFEAAGLSAPGG